jgi:hypothetical protein
MKCLEKTVERRYESMGNLAEDLQRFISGAEVSALRDVSPSSEMVAFASHSDESAKTKTLESRETTELVPARGKSWWQFWTALDNCGVSCDLEEE